MAKRKEYGFSFYGSIVIAVAVGCYAQWAKAKGLNTSYIAAGMLLILGVFVTLLAFHLKDRLYYLGAGIPGIFLGISFIIWPAPKIVILSSCLTMIVTGIGMACIQTLQLKAGEKKNGTN